MGTHTLAPAESGFIVYRVALRIDVSFQWTHAQATECGCHGLAYAEDGAVLVGNIAHHEVYLQGHGAVCCGEELGKRVVSEVKAGSCWYA